MSESEREELLRRKAELEERIAFLESEQDGGGLAAVKAEGAAIVAAREAQLESDKAAEPEPEPVVEAPPPKPKKKRRRRRRKARAEEGAVPSALGTGAVSAAHRSLDPADSLPDYTLRRDDGSEYTVSANDRDVGPGARR